MSDMFELDSDLKDLLNAEKAVPAIAPAAKAAMLGALSAKLGAAGAGAASLSAGAGAAGKTLAIARWKAHLALLGALALGSGTTALLMRPKERIVYVERASAPVSEPTPAPSAPSVPVESLPVLKVPPVVPASEASAQRTLGAERALLDVARTALGNGDPSPALAACERHARDFAHGALAEEREAIAVRALGMAGRRSEAKKRGERFLLVYPRSLMRDPVESALRSQNDSEPHR